MEAVTTRGKCVMNDLNEICDTQQKTLNDKKSALERFLVFLDHCIEFVTLALDRGTDVAILKTKE